MDSEKPRNVWTSDSDFEVVPPLLPSDMLRFMATPEYADALRIWHERNAAAGGEPKAVVVRPAGVLLDDIMNGGPVDPAKSRHFH